MNAGDWQQALEYAACEREVAARLHSRERLAWTYLGYFTFLRCVGRYESGRA